MEVKSERLLTGAYDVHGTPIHVGDILVGKMYYGAGMTSKPSKTCLFQVCFDQDSSFGFPGYYIRAISKLSGDYRTYPSNVNKLSVVNLDDLPTWERIINEQNKRGKRI